MKAIAHNPETLKQMWEAIQQTEQFWGKEMFYAVSLAVDITKGCSYCTNFDTAILKQLGWEDAKIEAFVNTVAWANWGTTYAEGLQLEPDVTPAVVARKMAA